VADVLIYADTIRSPDLRHEVPILVPDAFLYAERDGRRYVVVASMEVPRIAELGVAEVLPLERFGVDELHARGVPRHLIWPELVHAACSELGVSDAVVPADFPLELADFLRDRGVSLRAERGLFEGRRRVKNEHELAGIRRAQRAAEAAMAAAIELLRRSSPNGAYLAVDGETLTSERLKQVVEDELLRHNAVIDDPIVSHGPQTAIGHESGSGPIAAGEAVLFDLFPRDRASACYADMTRTYVVGDAPDELREYHRLCREALDRAVEGVRPGVEGSQLHRLTCEFFEAHGYPTQLSKKPGEVLEDGFFHALGHGVGLEVHEEPGLGRTGETLVAGDVVALEPGLYRSGFGGCRLEDLVLVTDSGAERLTDFPYDLELT
jgi:Xaa-Pro aminopeptidase